MSREIMFGYNIMRNTPVKDKWDKTHQHLVSNQLCLNDNRWNIAPSSKADGTGHTAMMKPESIADSSNSAGSSDFI
jgi:hypothetical protein